MAGFPPSSTEDRAQHLFNAGYKAAADWMPHDSDEGQPGVKEKGMTILYVEVNKEGSCYLWKADFPVTTERSPAGGFTRSIQPAVIKEIALPGPGCLPIIYFHFNDAKIEITMCPPDSDAGALLGMEGIIKMHAGDLIGGEISAIRITASQGSGWLKRNT